MGKVVTISPPFTEKEVKDQGDAEVTELINSTAQISRASFGDVMDKYSLTFCHENDQKL